MKRFAMRSQACFFCEDADRFDVTISPPVEPINDYVAKRRDGSYAFHPTRLHRWVIE
jgi:hypothetical protein